MQGFRAAFPDLKFWGAADLIAEGDYVVGRWEGGGTHTGPAFSDFLHGSLPAASGRKMHFTGTTVLRVQDGKISEEIGLDGWGGRAPTAWHLESCLTGMNRAGIVSGLISVAMVTRSAPPRGHC
jgi:SnoaL-like polyketide cyclase